MPRVLITADARHELLDRMAAFRFPTGVRITGPMQEDCRAPDSLEEAWLIEKAYGPAPRWVLEIVPLATLEHPTVEVQEFFRVEKIGDIAVGIPTSKRVEQLRVELQGDTIHVYEVDA
jgi:hypothetical protein